jgi:RHS repeat-associated protein
LFGESQLGEIKLRSSFFINYCRSLSPYINQFLSADTIVPGYANPQNLNRYAYVLNNPLRYIDPTGHMACSDIYDFCGQMVFDGHVTASILRRALRKYNVKLKGNWETEQATAVYQSVTTIGAKFASERGNGESASEAFKQAFGSTTFEWGCTECTKLGRTVDADTIQFRALYGSHNTLQMLMNTNLVIHELGHMFENTIASRLPDGRLYKPARSSLPANLANNRDGLGAQWIYQQSDDISSGEIFADMFVGWVQGVWALDIDGSLTDMATQRSNWMNQNMPTFLDMTR